jgi:primosomal protein N' (replication factor Y)
VLVDCPGAQGLFTYTVPLELTITPGDILSVPFGHQQVGAIAIRAVAALPQGLAAHQVKPVAAVISPGVFSPRYWQLLEAVADYYQTPLMQVIRTALPPGLLARSQRRVRLTPTAPDAAHPPPDLSPTVQRVLSQLQRSPSGDYTWQYLNQQVTGASRALRPLIQRGWVESYLALPQPPRPQRRQAVTVVAADPAGEDLSPRQREVLRVLQRRGGDWWLQDALQTCRTTSATLRTLAKKGYVEICGREKLRQPDQPDLAPDRPKTLTDHQQAALTALNQLAGGEAALLHGVTGSGKTEVYLQAIAPRLAQGQSALVLVPEIGLTPQLTDRFRQRFGDRVCVYHSALSEGERYDAWRQMLDGDPPRRHRHAIGHLCPPAPPGHDHPRRRTRPQLQTRPARPLLPRPHRRPLAIAPRPMPPDPRLRHTVPGIVGGGRGKGMRESGARNSKFLLWRRFA